MRESAVFAHSLQGWFGFAPLWFWAAISALLVIFLLALPFGGFATYVERKISADLQDRIGPNRVGPLGIFQFLADAVKMLAKEDFVPVGGDRFLYNFAPCLVVGGACCAFAVLPLGEYLIGADINIGIFYLFAVSTLVAPGILLGSWSSNNKWSLLGGLRGAAQIVSYEIPVALSILPVVLLSGSMQVGEIVQQQGWAWDAIEKFHFWNVFHNPFTFFAVFLLFIGGLAETNRIPFDLPEAESELVSGFNTEFSGMRFGLYALGEFVEVFVMSSVVTALYLGGWHVPFLNLDAATLGVHLPAVLIVVVQLGAFLTKTLFLVFVVMWLRWTLPRLRVDQLMGFCWKGLIPLSLMNLFGTALWMWAFNGKSIAQLLFLGGGSGGGH